MSGRDPVESESPGEPGAGEGPTDGDPDWHSDELVGLDPEDPEAQAFAAHLARMRRDRPGFTVEGYLDGVSDFADSANRAQGGRRLGAVLLVALLLVIAGVLIWDAAVFVLATWF